MQANANNTEQMQQMPLPPQQQQQHQSQAPTTMPNNSQEGMLLQGSSQQTLFNPFQQFQQQQQQQQQPNPFSYLHEFQLTYLLARTNTSLLRIFNTPIVSKSTSNFWSIPNDAMSLLANEGAMPPTQMLKSLQVLNDVTKEYNTTLLNTFIPALCLQGFFIGVAILGIVLLFVAKLGIGIGLGISVGGLAIAAITNRVTHSKLRSLERSHFKDLQDATAVFTSDDEAKYGVQWVFSVDVHSTTTVTTTKTYHNGLTSKDKSYKTITIKTPIIQVRFVHKNVFNAMKSGVAQPQQMMPQQQQQLQQQQFQQQQQPLMMQQQQQQPAMVMNTYPGAGNAPQQQQMYPAQPFQPQPMQQPHPYAMYPQQQQPMQWQQFPQQQTQQSTVFMTST
ncbi:hypothetical protein HDV05_005885 [Chytridiales sp. JEL 0842]|nr:hypothetical protein HDV05_005885 [Chytridiales sp. JEL 0842]